MSLEKYLAKTGKTVNSLKKVGEGMSAGKKLAIGAAGVGAAAVAAKKATDEDDPIEQIEKGVKKGAKKVRKYLEC